MSASDGLADGSQATEAVVGAYAPFATARIFDWLSEPSRPEDRDLAAPLAISLLDRRSTLIISGLSTAVASATAWVLTGALWTIVWFLGDMLLSLVRVLAMEHARRNPSVERLAYVPILMSAGLAWSVFTGIIGAMCMSDANPVVAVLGAVVTAGYAGGISSRNAATPRYAMLIIVLTLLPLSVGAAISTIPGMTIAGILIPIWALGTIGIMKHNHHILVRMMRAEAAMRQLALTDVLTGLPNRAFIDMKLDELCDRLMVQDDAKFSLLLVDLDGFKTVNDTHGHRSGDQLLQQVAGRISKVGASRDFICRLGGDEFLVIVPGKDPQIARPVARRIIESLSNQFEIDGGLRFQIGASVGSAFAPRDGTSPSQLLAAADDALYAAKEAGKGIHVEAVGEAGSTLRRRSA